MLSIFKRNHLKKTLPIALLIFSVLIFFHKFFYPDLKILYTPDFGSSDAFHFNYSLKSFLSQSLKDNQLPLWSDNFSSGFPLLAEGQIGTFNLFNLLFFKFLPTYLAFNLSIIVIFSTLIIGQYLFLTALNLSTIPAVLGATAFAFSTYFTAKITHFNHIQAASFLPLIIYFVELYLKKPKMKPSLSASSAWHSVRLNRTFYQARVKYLIFIIFLFSQQIFSGYPLMVFITFLLISFRFVFLFLKEKFRFYKIISFLVPFVFAAVLTIGLSAIQILAQIEYLKLSNLKSGFSFEQATRFHYHPKNLLRFLHPFLIGNPTNGTYESIKYGIFWENSSFLGIIPFILTIGSLFFFKNRWIKYFFSLSFASLLLSLGKDSPLYFIFTFFPFNLFRVPSRYLLIAVFSLSCLSALFLENIKKKFDNKAFFHVVSSLLIIFTFFQLYSFFSSYHLLVNKDELLKKPEILTILEKEADFKKFYTYGDFISWSKNFKTNWHNKSIFLFLKNNLQPNSSLIWNIASENSYMTQYPLRLIFYQNEVLGIKFHQGASAIEEFLNLLPLEKFKKGLKITGVTHLILPVEVENKSLEKITKLTFDDEEIYLYRIKAPNPKFWISKNYKLAKTVEQVGKITEASEFDYQKTVVLEKKIDLPLDQNNNPVLEVVKDLPQEKTIRIRENKNPSLLIINQSFYPGWQAFIDDKQTEILAANLNQQALIVSSGDHTINLIYKPKSFSWGLKISAISLLILFVLFLLAANKNLQTLLPFARPGNTPDKSFVKKPKQKHH